MTVTADTVGCVGAEPVPEGDPITPQAPRRLRPREFKTSDAVTLALSLLSSFSVVWILFSQFTMFSGAVGFVIVWLATFLLMYWLVNVELHGRQVAADRFLASLVTTGALCMVTPLVLLSGYVVVKGWHLLAPHVFLQTQQGVGPLSPPGKGGLSEAIVGTLEQVSLAAVMGIPAAVITAVFINEIGGRFTSYVRVVVTAMSGTPAILAGLFVYSIWIVSLHQGFSGFAGAIALAILLLPTVTRGTEEVLKVVHDELREAALALGAPEWRTVWSVVLPTARSGLVTATLLGVAVSIGETAPLLLTIFGNNLMNANPFNGPQAALPLVAYQQIRLPRASAVELGFTAALILFILVFTVFVLARVLGSNWFASLLRRETHLWGKTRRARAVGIPRSAGQPARTTSADTP